MKAHPTALIDPGARIAEDVEIGAYTIIGPQVTIGEACRIGPQVVITGRTTIGRNNRIFQFSSLGDEPQDKKYAGEDTELVIGDDNTIREFCTFNRGTVQGGGVTRIGNDNWLMAYVHIAHDCVIGDHVIMANNASLAGHVVVGDWAVLAGFSLVHQFCSIGAHAFTSFASHINQSVPPYVTVAGEKARPKGINSEGLKRRGFTAEQIRNVRRAYRTLYRDGLSLEDARQELEGMAAQAPEIRLLVEFIDHDERGILR
ncbi:MAG: acyl-ACP--UDP-N-acetylglucosamine O-acyltransferase [Xanthomonadales bacterium]|nr:acyl-ACP--UDP-N-acetylglucosamine O-acyltransferase [Xanthomonadales bacterium]NIN59293.1 acyl-ACP--UDP-N-acetylglucosamine O-acyltransferase [Xanthomonadales bacterium]NIN74655.1 acyl-ACP--UDP-N-acetylglucosamine O-acyltransferase [Xanthomonadales bacterium]NIO13321.1 acyl-ACP--UDP-N-acetylglucosamine O-acyltransferase [Xanthomonadales bacterium]NIP11686.1 acyl-ACP--UDP-N-acetylglucosamine O-acyltransferase [Xanthomonadales bacterium]